MKQVLQNLRSGETKVEDVPAPGLSPGTLLIQTRASLISAGTERMLVEFGKGSLLAKARSQPEKVKQVLDKIKTDGLLPTLEAVFNRLDEPLPLGYCNCGVVLEAGKGVEGFEVGDRVVSNGPHAEIVCVPKNLCAKVPDCVSDEEAAFTVLASIGLQGIRLMKPTLGETIVVFGLGLIGLICVQLFKSCACKVIGIDINRKRLELAEQFGAETIDASSGVDVVESAIAKSRVNGVDGVLITASAKEDSIVRQSAQMCRKRGRIVLVGVVDLKLDRADFYEKELSFQVSCSYGPGRYDSNYEQKGQDYPPGFVRWTEQRNFQAVLDALASGGLKVKELISEGIPLEQASRAYQRLTEDKSTLALILTYPKETPARDHTVKTPAELVRSAAVPQAVVGLIGAGNFAKMTLLPALKPIGTRLKTVADINGVAAAHAGRKFGFEQTTNDYQQLLGDPEINTVIITTRHDLHAPMVIEALGAGKHVAVEKPLCLDREQLIEIKQTLHKAKNRQLLVG
ncbi:MAG: Gfo/Idh/MocA family oxidoreductase, partial [Actinobacteria bacterium]|nr:Gfo/Idh/MocA family oxidoreductase [Actinomycetota bacterium]